VRAAQIVLAYGASPKKIKTRSGHRKGFKGTRDLNKRGGKYMTLKPYDSPEVAKQRRELTEKKNLRSSHLGPEDD